MTLPMATLGYPKLTVRLFLDSCDTAILQHYPGIDGITTNPSMMRQAGVINYAQCARQLVQLASKMPVSISVLSNELNTIQREALQIATWGDNAWVKIPILTATGQSTLPVILDLLQHGVMINVTCIMTQQHLEALLQALPQTARCCLSVFAGRIADTGHNPATWLAPYITQTRHYPNLYWLWASTREILNVQQASDIGCDIVTLTPALMANLSRLGKPLLEFAHETVRQFSKDIDRGNYRLEPIDANTVAS